ncbi:hypothetical protein MVEN_01660600 [Mycena venus]|uniref:Uncharacterized protein n=1 Tax=Mycena venus TaxID=2733690 RepID=A0A8H7CP52_9AGAR|nr:hypothetical protein MVEN_01660600 [Mycena venus]
MPMNTGRSLHSWWSDRNPPGATIPLHTLAKPLSRFLHRRQVAGIIAKSQSMPLTEDVLDVLTCYLEARDSEITSTTKIMILDELTRRAWQWEAETRTMLHKDVHFLIFRMLHSTDTGILASTCTTLGALAGWGAGKSAILKLNPQQLLVALSKHFNYTVQHRAIYALNRLGLSSGAAPNKAAFSGGVEVQQHHVDSRRRDRWQTEIPAQPVQHPNMSVQHPNSPILISPPTVVGPPTVVVHADHTPSRERRSRSSKRDPQPQIIVIQQPPPDTRERELW